MGLRKEMDTGYGTTADYWKVSAFHYASAGTFGNTPFMRGLDLAKPIIQAKIGLYADRDAATGGAIPFRTEGVQLNVEADNDLLRKIYIAAKSAIPDLSDAEDVFEEGQQEE